MDVSNDFNLYQSTRKSIILPILSFLFKTMKILISSFESSCYFVTVNPIKNLYLKMSLLQVHKNEEVTNNLDGKFFDVLTFQEQFVYPLTFYSVWQLWYLFITFTVVEKDKTLMTSMRYLAKDHKNPMTIVGGKLAIYLGMYQ